MSFLILSIFLSIIMGSSSLFIFPNLQFASSQTDIISSLGLENVSIKITSPPQGKHVPVGELTVSGISSDNQDKNCIVFIDWNDLKPFQPVRAAGPGGVDDFSEWIYTFDSKYHKIVEGINELTSKITCLEGNKPLSKWYSINVTGYTTDGASLPSLNKNTSINSSYNPQIPFQTVMPDSVSNTGNVSNKRADENSSLTKLSNIIPPQNNPTFKTSQNPQIPFQTVMPDSVSNTDNFSNNMAEENSTLLGTLNPPNSEIEIIVPNESTHLGQNNNTKPILDHAQGNTNKNFTNNNSFIFIPQTPPIDLDEQSAIVNKEQPQQPQQQQQQQQRLIEQNNSNNISNGHEGQPPQTGKPPTQGVFPPFKLPSIFP